MSGIFIKTCHENPGLVEIRQNIRNLEWRPKYVYDNIPLNSEKKKKNVQINIVEKSKHIFHVEHILYENHATYITKKNVAQQDRP
jgi:hypothetical protein